MKFPSRNSKFETRNSKLTSRFSVFDFRFSLRVVFLLSAGLFALAACGGGGGGGQPIPTPNPVPSITSLQPSSVAAGSTGFTLTVNGSGFVTGAVVRWNGSNRMTSFVSNGQVTAQIPSTDVAAAGSAQVTVFNPSPGGGTSNPATFTITGPAFVIATTQLPSTSAGKQYDFTLTTTGGVTPITWALDLGTTLPTGITLDGSTGRLSGTVGGGAATQTFTVRATDSSGTPPATRSLTISVLGSLGSNNSCTPGSTVGTTPISNGTIRASLSPYGDIDVYSFQGTSGAQITIETFAQRLELDADPLTRDSFADTIVELLDSACTRLAFHDDIDPGVIQDSLLTFTLPGSGTQTFFIRVRDFRGDGRPDLIYELRLSGAN